MTENASTHGHKRQFPEFGPWLGVLEDRQRICAVVGCEQLGAPQFCMWDGTNHHHGCVHYDCTAARLDMTASGHVLRFRKGWGWLCDEHYGMLVESRVIRNTARA